MTDPIRPTDDEARALARRLLADADHAALGVIDPATGGPWVSRVAMLWHGGAVELVVSDLAPHAAAMRADPRVSLLVGEPGAKGDALTHPRLTLAGRAAPGDKAGARARWLAQRPKSAVWFDLPDFRLVRIAPGAASLNGGFGRAFRLSPDDLNPP